MNLNRIHQGIVSLVEPIPTGASELQTIGILERGGTRVGNAISGMLRALLKGAPMNWNPWILKDNDRYHLERPQVITYFSRASACFKIRNG